MSNRTLNLTDPIYNYLLQFSLRETPIQAALREETSKMPSHEMQISPEQGQFMGLLIQLMKAKNTIEIGTYTGYSALSTALALPEDGKIIACDVNEEWTNIAKTYWEKSGVSHKIELHLAPALDTLDHLLHSKDKHDSFDFVFIDADKANYSLYYEKSLKLLKTGGLIVIDNTLWGGDVADLTIKDASTQAIRALNEKIFNDTRVSMSLLPISDGLTLVLKR